MRSTYPEKNVLVPSLNSFEIIKYLTGIKLTVLWYNMQAHMLNVEDEDVADD